MAYDEKLARRFRNALKHTRGVSEKRMMGGVCFMADGNMIGGADRTKTGEGRFMFRVGKDRQAEAAALPGADPMIQGGRRMTGFFFVNEDVCTEKVFKAWISLALNHALSLPAKRHSKARQAARKK